ncbi:MAG TPA: hypothetical protein VMV51_00245 [Gemmatimonadaceae bacterium]|nr:hypothetical protein [Gemmatimonadaceae bacterium]
MRRSRNGTRRLVAVGLLAAALPCTAPRLAAQRAPGATPATTPGRLIVKPFDGFTWIHDPAQRRAQKALAEGLLAVLRQDPAISHPMGYDVVLNLVAGDMPKGFNVGMTYFAGVEGEVRIFGYADAGSGEHGIVQVDAVDLRAFVNDRWCGGSYTEADSLPDGGPPIVEGLEPTASMHGHPSFDGMCVLITDRAPPPFVPVTRDRYRRVQVAQMRAQLKQNRTGMADMLADPKLGVTARAMLDTAQRVIDSLQRVADAASAADRARQAAVRTNGPSDSSLVAVGSSGADALVAPNAAFFDAALPRDRAQTIVLSVPYGIPGVVPRTYGDDEPGRRRVFTAIVDGLPWAALEAMVKH